MKIIYLGNDKDGYTVWYKYHPNIIAEGDTLAEAKMNLQSLFEFHRKNGYFDHPVDEWVWTIRFLETMKKNDPATNYIHFARLDFLVWGIRPVRLCGIFSDGHTPSPRIITTDPKNQPFT